jgi:hypothetical protein
MKENKQYLVRIGRVCWWGSLAFSAAIVVFGGGWLVQMASRYGGRFEWDDFFMMLAMCGIALLLGRGLRYVLANE